MYDHVLRVAVFDLRNGSLLSPTAKYPSTFTHIKRHASPLPGEPHENRARRIGVLIPESKIRVSKVLGNISLDFVDAEGYTPAYAVDGSTTRSNQAVKEFTFSEVRKAFEDMNKLPPELLTREDYINMRLISFGFRRFVKSLDTTSN